MMYAQDFNGERVEASKDINAFCPGCKNAVRAKCGDIMPHHWAHISKTQCDQWFENEGEWHLSWKKRFEESSKKEVIVEKFIKKENKWHFADIFTGKGAIELQHSPISIDTISKRELFYEKMIWLFDGTKTHNLSVNDYKFVREMNGGRGGTKKLPYWTFVWLHPKKTIFYANKTVFIDMGDDKILYIKKKYLTEKMRGWGYIISYEKFIEMTT